MPHFTKDQHDRVYRTDRPHTTAPAAPEAVKVADESTAASDPAEAAPAAPEASAPEA